MTAWQAVWVLILAGVLLAPLGLWLARDRDAAVDWTAVFQRIGQPDPLLDAAYADVQRVLAPRLRLSDRYVADQFDLIHDRLADVAIRGRRVAEADLYLIPASRER